MISLRTTRPFRAAAWPLLIGSALAAALVVVNPEARRPLRLASRPRRVDQQIASRPTTETSSLPSEAIVAKGHTDSDAPISTRSEESAERLDKADADTPHAVATDVTAADEPNQSPRTAPQPTVFNEASRETRSRFKTLLGWPDFGELSRAGLDRREAPELQSPGFRKAPTPATQAGDRFETTATTLPATRRAPAAS